MAVFYLDSSALVKRYVSETGTPWVVALTDPAAGHQVFVSRITGVEVVAAIARQRQSGALSTVDAGTALANFRHDLAYDFQGIDLSPPLMASAMTLADVHVLRAHDAANLPPLWK